MKHITILVPNGENNLSSIVGSYKILSRANQYWQQHYNGTPYKIELAGCTGRVSFYSGLFNVKPHTTINAINQTNLVIIPSLNHNYAETVKKNKALIAWLKTQHQQGAEIASICTGAFLLAATGILNGKSCSTHWSAADNLKKLHPEIKLETEKIITNENGIYTNGGAYSFLNLLLYLVEKKFNRQTAIYCSKVFQIEMDRHSQQEFTIFNGQKNHSDEIIQQAQAFIEKHPQQKISVESLSAKFAIGRRHFDRRFIKATGNTPMEYLHRAKMEYAKRQLETTRKNVNEVMQAVGYSDVKAFREVFKKVTGLSPSEYRNKYNNQSLPTHQAN